MVASNPMEVRYKLYELADVHIVPEAVGIYAWFLVPLLGKELVRRDPEKLVQRIEHLRNCLFFEANHRVEMTQDRGRFGSDWTATMKLGSPNIRFDALGLLQTPDRLAFIDHFRQVFTMLAPVVYVGKADNLRSRIAAHVRALEESVTPNAWGSSEESDERVMAERAALAGVELADLRFTFFEFPLYDGVTNATATNVLVEEFVNRLIQPRLGRK